MCYISFKYFLPFLSFLILLFPTNGRSEITVLFLGDSLTSGYGVAKGAAYPAVVAKLAAEDGFQLTVTNAGLSGDTSAGALRRVSRYLNQEIDILFLAIGANDGLRGLDPKIMQHNIESTISTFRVANSSGITVLAGMEAPPNMGINYTSNFRSAYSQIAEGEKVEFIPFFLTGVAGEPSLNISDRMHPNEEGHKIIATNVWRAIKPIVGKLHSQKVD